LLHGLRLPHLRWLMSEVDAEMKATETETWTVYFMTSGHLLECSGGVCRVYRVDRVWVFPAVWNFYFTGQLTHPEGA
jgi:hypothetical protein